MSTTPVFPPLVKKNKHRLHAEKAQDLVSKSVAFYHDSGQSSELYRIEGNGGDYTENTEIKPIKTWKTNTTGERFLLEKGLKLNPIIKSSNTFTLQSLDQHRDFLNQLHPVRQDTLVRDNDQDDSTQDNSSKKLKKVGLQWEEVSVEKESSLSPIRFVLSKRTSLGWNTRLPLLGNGARQAMYEYQDRLDDEMHSTLNDDGQFVYSVCLSDQVTNILYSPYDLRTVEPHEIKSGLYPVYYTATATFVTRVDTLARTEQATPVMSWLWEKKLFDKLRKIRTFYIFRKMITFKRWRMNMRRDKQDKSREYLRRRLFTANEVFQRVLLYIRNMCENASTSSDQVIMVKYDTDRVYTLDDFASIQNEQIECALSRLYALKQEAVDVTYNACIVMGRLEGIDFDAFFDSDNYTHENKFIESYLVQRHNRTSRMRDMHLSLPSKREKGPSYAARNEYRYVLRRLCEFLRMVDYLMQEMLHKIVRNSVKQLREYVIMSSGLHIGAEFKKHKEALRKVNLKQIESVNDIDDLLVEVQVSQKKAEKKIQPVFFVKAVLNIQKVERGAKEVDEEDIEDFDEEEEPTEAPVENETEKSYKTNVFMSFAPNESDFKNYFKDLITKYERTAGKIQTLLHDPQFALFYEIPLYELTTVERELRESTIESNILLGLGDEQTYSKLYPWPDVDFLFGEDENYQLMVSEVMKTFTLSLSKLTEYSESYKQFCEMIESTIKLEIDEAITKEEFTPNDLNFLLQKHHEYINSMKAMVTEQRIAVFLFQALEFQNDCLPYATNVIAKIDAYLPAMAIRRNEKLQETLRDALKMLDRDPTSVEEFVEHLAILTRINNDLPSLEREFNTITRLFSIATEFDLSINAEQHAYFKSLSSTFNHLKSSLLYTEAQSEENIRKFTVDLGKMINKAHGESVELKTRLQAPTLLSTDTTHHVARENLTLFHEMIEKLVERCKNYALYQERFNGTMKQGKKKGAQQEYMIQDSMRAGALSIANLQSELNEIEHDISLRKLLWDSMEEWDKLVKVWLSMCLDDIQVEVVQKDVNRFSQNIYLLEKGLPINELLPKLKDKVLDFKKTLPIIVSLRNPNLKARHYNQIRILIGHDLTNEQQKVTLSVLLEVNVLQYKDRILEISSLATNEATLENMLERIIEIWKKTDFRLVKDHAKDTFIITGTDEIQILLEESQVTMTTIKTSRFVGPIKSQVEDWDRRLTLFAKTLEEWIVCQKRWLYLKQIFSTPDIQRQLTQETKIFNQIEKFWKELMRKTDDKPNALRAATAPGLYENLQSYAVQMEKIQRSLEDYFETKRLLFPRLYFLSNEDLLEILSQSKDVQKIQPHLSKCFSNVNDLEVVERSNEITHLVSFEGEKLDLPKSVRIRGATEQWLGALENGMFDAVKRHLKFGINENMYNHRSVANAALSNKKLMPYKDWILKQPGQVVLLVSQINFSDNIVKSLKSESPAEALKEYRTTLIEAINTVANIASKDLANHKLLTIEALITIEVHSRDILSSLIQNSISSVDDFEWKRNLRYEWEENGMNCIVMQSDATFNYGYEYLGCSPRLVITPLTDRCYLTLTGGLKLNLGGAPSGPAGTGKTETVKDLAKSIGKLCLVFNCSEGLDYKMLGKFFSGLCQSGSWCCFDEFNRIDIEVLSVVAQQILSIRQAKDSLAPRFVFESREIKLNPTCGFFITMNPTYAGRVELPDNLKPLFRPVAMMVPDFALIAEIILFSVGFMSAKILATKIVTLYHLASRQLSQQDHYDFGMRTIKSVLLMAGQIKKNFVAETDLKGQQGISEEQESRILMQALNDTNKPKFLKEDVILFQNLMNDLFPDMKKINKNQEAMEKSINLAARELNYYPWPSQNEKILQLFDQVSVRHGVMLVGPSGGGKTISRNILQRALSILPVFVHELKVTSDKQKNPSNIRAKRGKVDQYVFNPKSISINELYGSIDPTTLEWTDGIFANSVRSFVSNWSNGEIENENSWQFIVLDGPIDTLWVENLNSVLDDSKVLCLSNGERINFTPNMRVLFEVDSLVHASPATVSRCGMVYFEPSDLGLTPILKNWYTMLPKGFPSSGVELIDELIEFSLKRGFGFIEKRKTSTSFPFHPQNVLTCLMGLTQAFIEFFDKTDGFGDVELTGAASAHDKKSIYSAASSKTTITLRGDEAGGAAADINKRKYFIQRNPKLLSAILTKIYIFSYTWAFGGILKREDNADDENIINQKSHVKTNLENLTMEFDEFMREMFETNVKYSIYMPPNAKSVFDYFIDVTTGNYVEWDQLLPSNEKLIRQSNEFMIPTIDSLRFSFLATLLLQTKNSVLITGSSGIGKSITVEHMLKKLNNGGFSSKSNHSVLGEIFNFAEKEKASMSSNMPNFISDETELSTKRLKTTDDQIGVLANKIQFSAQTNSSKFLAKFVTKFLKKGQNLLGAPRGKSIITFIDDLNTPIADRFGDQAPLELLRFMNENSGFYDLKACTFKNMTDNKFLACCDTPTSVRSSISSRLVRQFCILSIPDPSARSLVNIYHVQLGRFFAENDFNIEIKSNLSNLVLASIIIYYRVFLNMLPTPSKSHYIFNLRDLSKLVKGMMQASPNIITTKETLVELFSHECLRVFSDRFVDSDDHSIFHTHLSDTIMDYFKVNIVKDAKKNQHSQQAAPTKPVSEEDESVFLFADFLKPEERVYQPLTSWKQLVSVLSEFQMRSNMSGHASKQIVFFKEAVEHLCRACRVLRQSGGHMLLIGIDGTGKSTMLELAAYISNCEVFKLNVKKGYSYSDFRDDLKNVFKATGVQQKKIVFFVADRDISDDMFLEDLACLLTSGDIPDLFDPDELNSLFMDLKNDALKEGVSEEKNELYKYLLTRVRANLHLVLSMSPVGEKFRERCRVQPAIINCTTLDWYNDWTEHAMKQVSMSFMENVELEIGGRLEKEERKVLKEKISQSCVFIHMSLVKAAKNFLKDHNRHYYVTPSLYIDLLRTFGKIFDINKNEYIDNLERLKNGLEKLSDANEMVAIMKEELVLLGPQIEVKQKETEELMAKLEKDQQAVNEVKAIAAKEEEKMRNETELVRQYANEAEKDLASVKPLLVSAKESLNSLNKTDISEVRVYNNPPYLVMTVMCAVCIILGKKPDWSTAKQILSDPSFITKLVNFEAESVTDKTYAKFRQYSKNPDFKPEIVGHVSKACRSLCIWVLAMERFHEVYRTVKPKEKKVHEANQALDVMRQGLRKKQDMLEKIEGHLNNFKRRYEESVNEKRILENRKELMRSRMQRAVELTEALDTEKERWTTQYESLKNQSNSIIGISLMSAAAINYLGAMSQDYRQSLLAQWMRYCNQEANLYVIDDFDLTKHLAKKTQIRNWINQKLPDDQYSIENAVFLNYSIKWPLIIDPQNQAVRWIKEMEGMNLKICKMDDPQVFRTLEQAIRFGQPILIENLTEYIDPVLDSVLKKEILIRGSQQKIMKLGDVEVEYNESFRLFLVTSLANPHYLPSAFIKVNLINFTITFKCLFEQLLSQIVLKERPELEAERTVLLESISKDFLTLRELEDKSLNILSQSETSKVNREAAIREEKMLLDDQNLIDVLKQSKSTSKDIQIRLDKNEKTEKSLNTIRQTYSEIATRGSILFFTVQNLASLNIMYQFSLNWFYNLFKSCLDGVSSQSGESMGSIEAGSQLQAPKLINLEDMIVSGKPREESNISSKTVENSDQTATTTAAANREFKSEEEFKEYIETIVTHLTHTVYHVVSLALFNAHKLIFSFSLSINILKHEESSDSQKIGIKDYNFFLNSTLLADMQHDALSKRIKATENLRVLFDELFIDERKVRQLILLEDVLPDKFKSTCQNMLENTKSLWKRFIMIKDPYQFMSYEDNWSTYDFSKLTKFQRLILIKILRPDALILSVDHFISETLGSKFLVAPIPNLADLYNQSSSVTPIIFILSPGSDPTSQLLRFAKDLRGNSLHLEIVSLGQGQGPRAEELISKSIMLKGRWVYLQNCHLAASFMPRLQQIVNNYSRSGAEIDKQFRLFLSSKPNNSFPVSLLKAGIKMTIEPPNGLKNNLKQNFSAGGFVNKKLFENPENGPNWKRLVFSIGFIHALIHERKKFGTLGWNLPYEFNSSDFEVAILQLQSVLTTNPVDVPFNVLKYVTGEVIYGGRVTDDYDRRCLLNMLENFFCQKAIEDSYYIGDNESYEAPAKDIEYSKMIEFIDQLPDEDDPSVFGMNIYAENMVRAVQADNLINAILTMEPLQKASSRLDEIINHNDLVLGICKEIRDNLTQEITPVFSRGKHMRFDEALIKLKEILGDSYYESSTIITTVKQEIDRYNILLKVMFNSIKELEKAIKGEVVISKSLENMIDSLVLQRVPDVWNRHAYPSLKPLASWIKNLAKRITFFSLWSRNMILFAEGQTQHTSPFSIWISGFIFPQGLLASISQKYARKYHTSIDRLEFKYELQNSIYDEGHVDVVALFDENNYTVSSGKEDGILLCGFYLDGAKWDRRDEILLDSPHRYNQLPHFLCKLAKKASSARVRANTTYVCPVYRNSVRAGSSNDQAKNFVTEIEIKTREEANFWTLRGLCIILENDD